MVIRAWRQVFLEAGGSVPDRNVERLLHRTHVPVVLPDERNMDLVVPGLNVAWGQPLFCDVTVVSPLTRNGRARPATSNAGGALLRQAVRDNNSNYDTVLHSGVGALYCLGHQAYGRWCDQADDMLPFLARERS